MTSQATVHKHVADQQAGCFSWFKCWIDSLSTLSTFDHAGLGERYLGHGTRLGTLQQNVKLRFALPQCSAMYLEYLVPTATQLKFWIYELWGKHKENYINTHISCKYVGPLLASYWRTQNWYKFRKAWYFPAWEISWVWSFSSVVLGHLDESPSLDRFFLSHRPGFKVFILQKNPANMSKRETYRNHGCHGTLIADIFLISQKPWVKLWLRRLALHLLPCFTWWTVDGWNPAPVYR